MIKTQFGRGQEFRCRFFGGRKIFAGDFLTGPTGELIFTAETGIRTKPGERIKIEQKAREKDSKLNQMMNKRRK